MVEGRAIPVVGAILLLGCGGSARVPPLSPGAPDVEFGKSDPGPGFVELGPIESSHGSGCGLYGTKGSYEGAYITLRNEAARMGADYVRIDVAQMPHSTPGCYVNEYKLSGVAFRHARKRRATPAAPPPVASVSRSPPGDPAGGAPSTVELATPDEVAAAGPIIRRWIGYRVTLELEDGDEVYGVLARYRDSVLVLIMDDKGRREAFHVSQLARARLASQ
jgi:hypothetical protein